MARIGGTNSWVYLEIDMTCVLPPHGALLHLQPKLMEPKGGHKAQVPL